ncbi:DUF739 family protein [Paraclostridium sordellii]|uniref:DUF739 family protein n=1 Tax=Paraclostridium sordellii TaxID=1505 RepID=UPI0005E5787B|nr:DUF739 family protein [Paeniclostridium sordellii]CEO20644.1 Uncharacterised protein [[Clostridium] sordellii] [Paeniclostridium sordellii]
MAFDYRKLKGKIVEEYGTQGCFAKALGVSERTLSLKLNNKVFFTQNEMKKCSELLNIDLDKILIYFFKEKVQ